MTIRILIPSGAGAPGFAGILNCLKQEPNIEVVAGDMSHDAYGKSLADAFEVLPPSTDPNYIDMVINTALKYQCNVVLPITTSELIPLAKNAALFVQNNISLVIGDYDSIKIANNKAALYSFLVLNNLPCPDFAVVDNKVECIKNLELLGIDKRTLVMKPAEGNGSRGFRIIATSEFVQNAYFDTKAGATYTCIEALQAELPNVFNQKMLICEYLPGKEYSVDILAKKGEIMAIATRSRDKTISGISVRGTFEHHAEIENQVQVITEKLKLDGPIGMQFKIAENGIPKMLEINPRLQGAVSSALLAGINFPLAAVKQTLGMPVDVNKTSKSGIRFNRYWTDIKI